ncbi:MAG: DUF3147 domain-containing protein [Euryarchaeota archaeon]|nr:DUF3147 domain-containing protein [Euryarchaeota archaeon]
MDETIKFLAYFILGGLILSVVTYFGGKKEGLVAAFFAMFPVVTTLSLFTIYSEAGANATVSYIQGLLLLTPVWILYLLCVFFLIPKYGFWIALVSGIAVYIVAALVFVLGS